MSRYFLLVLLIIIGALFAATRTVQTQTVIDPGRVPDISIDLSEKIIVAVTSYNGAQTMALQSALVIPGVAPVLEENNPPLHQVEILDEFNQVILSFGAWPPGPSELYSASPGDVLDTGASNLRGSYAFPFDPRARRFQIYDLRTGVTQLIDANLLPPLADYCTLNPTDPDCAEVVRYDLALTKTVLPPVSYLNEAFVYTLIASNAGPFNAPSVTITDALPPNVTLQSVPPECSLAGSVLTCNLGDILSGTTREISLSLMASGPGILVNTASVASTNTAGVMNANDVDLSNNTASVSVEVLNIDRYVVSSCNASELIAAVNSANQSSTDSLIELNGSCTYNLDRSNNNNQGFTGLPAIQRTDQGGTLTIDGKGATIRRGGAQLRFFYVPQGADLTLKQMTLSDADPGGDSRGGAIFNQGNVTLDDVVVRNNRARRDGAIYNSGSLTIYNSTFNDNNASEEAGAINNAAGTVYIADSTFERNRARWGGAIYSQNGAVTVINSIMRYHDNPEQGSGIWARGGSLYVHGSTLANNRARYGTGVYAENVAVIITDTTFNNNYAAEQGAGLYLNGGSAEISGSTFHTNEARFGTGIYIRSASLNLLNDTFSNQRAVESGAGVYNAGNRVDISHVTFSGNSARFGHAIFTEGGRETQVKSTVLSGSQGTACSGPFTNAGANLATDNSCSGAMIVSNANMKLGSLTDNGGPTATHALLDGSPALNIADCTTTQGTPVTTDQRGFIRPAGPGCDAGAYEADLISVNSLEREALPDAIPMETAQPELTIVPILDQSSLEGDAIELLVIAGWDDGSEAVLRYSAEALPAGLTINPVSGLISGAITEGAAANSPYEVSVSAIDAEGTRDDTQFIWTVSVAELTEEPAAETPEEPEVTATVNPEQTAEPIPESTETSVPEITEIPDPETTAEPLPEVTEQPAPETTAEPSPEVTEQPAPESTAEPLPEVSVQMIADQTSIEGDAVSLQVIASVINATDTDLQYNAANSLPPGLTIDRDNGLINGVIAPDAYSNSPYIVTVTAVHASGVYSFTTFLWTVVAPEVTEAPILVAPQPPAPGFSGSELIEPSAEVTELPVPESAESTAP